MTTHQSSSLSLSKQHGFSLFELILVTVVIGILAATAMSYYVELMEDARKSTLRSQASNFDAALTSVHAHWYMGEAEQLPAGGFSYVEVGDSRVYLNRSGWPIAAKLSTELSEAMDLEAEASNPEKRTQVLPVQADSSVKTDVRYARPCAQLWYALLRNASKISVAGSNDQRGDEKYHVSSQASGHCRYELLTNDEGAYYFDYWMSSGRVLITIPAEIEEER